MMLLRRTVGKDAEFAYNVPRRNVADGLTAVGKVIGEDPSILADRAGSVLRFAFSEIVRQCVIVGGMRRPDSAQRLLRENAASLGM